MVSKAFSKSANDPGSKTKLFFKNYLIFSKVSVNPIIPSRIFEKNGRIDIGQ